MMISKSTEFISPSNGVIYIKKKDFKLSP